jgi:hypothetical protein
MMLLKLIYLTDYGTVWAKGIYEENFMKRGGKMNKKIRITVNPGKMNADDEEVLHQVITAITNAFLIEQCFFHTQRSDTWKTIHMEVIIKTVEANFSQALYRFLKNIFILRE